MSLYNMVAGNNITAGLCLAMLGGPPVGIPRLRDAWMTDDGLYIHILTRTGGGNREEYEHANAAMCEVEGYVDNYDDSFDSTFAHYVYQVPAVYQADVKPIVECMYAYGKGADTNGPAAIVERITGNATTQPIPDPDPALLAAANVAYTRILDAVAEAALQ